MKLRKKILLSLSVLPLLGLATYFFVQKPNICTREHFWDDSLKYTYCKITDDYLKVNRPEASKLIKTYEYFVFNDDYYHSFYDYNDSRIFILSRQLLLFQWSWYRSNLYNMVKNNLDNDSEYYEKLFGYLKYVEEFSYQDLARVWKYSIIWDTEEEYQKNYEWFQSTLNTVSESLIQQVDNDMPTYKWADFRDDIIQFVCVILSLILITLFSILILKKTKSIPMFFATLIFDSLIFCCWFDLFNELPHILLSILHILLGLILVWISGIILWKAWEKESLNLFIQNEHSIIYTNILSIIKILGLMGISRLYFAWIDTIFRYWESVISPGISSSIWIEVILIQIGWICFDIYLSLKLIKYIKNSNMKKWLIILLISLIIITFICKLMTINEIDIPWTNIIYTISFIVCIINIIIFVFWANRKLIKLNECLINLFPKYSKIISKKSEEIFK